MSVTWHRAREEAYQAGRSASANASLDVALRGEPASELDQALGCALTAGLRALAPLPAFDMCSMDGWAVSGSGPWEVLGQVLAGESGSAQRPLQPGQACVISTGSMIPAGADGLLRFEEGSTKDVVLQSHPAIQPTLRDVRPAGCEARVGDLLAAAGERLTPPLAGLAAATGHDHVSVVPRPDADVFVIGNELLTSGAPGRGRVRDSLGIQAPAWIRAGGGRPGPVERLRDDATALTAALTRSRAQVLITTGGSSRGRSDHVLPVMTGLGATMLVDGVDLRPGGPMKLGELPDGRLVVALPGNPLAALAGVVTLLWPVLAGLGCQSLPGTVVAVAGVETPGHPRVTSLVPMMPADAGGSAAVRPVEHLGPAMLRGIASASAFGVVPPGGVRAGNPIELVPLPW